MAKISIDIEHIKTGLHEIGYEISDCIQKGNNGKNWQLKFNNSGAVVTIYLDFRSQLYPCPTETWVYSFAGMVKSNLAAASFATFWGSVTRAVPSA